MRAASQAEDDADTSRTPGLNASVQTSLNDHGVCYYLCYNKSASVIPYLIIISCEVVPREVESQ